MSGKLSNPSSLTCGVPQGSVLGPDLFLDHITPVATLIRSFGISVHGHADDTQLYDTFRPGVSESAVRANREAYIKKLHSWKNLNKLKPNDSKTKFIIMGTASSLRKINTTCIRIGDHDILLSTSVQNIGGYFDSQMKMDGQV